MQSLVLLLFSSSESRLVYIVELSVLTLFVVVWL